MADSILPPAFAANAPLTNAKGRQMLVEGVEYSVVEMVDIRVMGSKYYELPILMLSGLLELKRQPNNAYDKNAIGIYKDGQQLANCPAVVAKIVAAAIDKYDKPVYAILTSIVNGNLNFKVLQPNE